jgi:predicted O-linked N-acetylglucosamine transferase (SPINDLY family)
MSLPDAFRQALSFHQRGEFAEARRLYKLILREHPDHFDTLHFLGIIEAQRGGQEKAEQLIRKALRVNPDSAEAYSNLGNIQRDLRKHKDALTSYEKALRIRPNYANALNNQGAALLALHRFEEALTSFDRALALEPKFAGAAFNRGVALMHLRQPEEALASFESALQVEPNSTEAHAERAGALMALGRMEEALGAYDTALLGMPDATDTLYNRGVALLKMQRTQDALASFEKVLQSDPGHVAALTNRGNALFELGRVDEALASFDKALARKPKYADALTSRGAALASVGRLDDALTAYGKAITVAPDDANSLTNRGMILQRLGRHAEAASAYEAALKVDRGYKYGLGRLISAKTFACDWLGLAELIDRLAADVSAGKLATNPFTLLSVRSEPSAQLACAQAFAADKYPKAPDPLYRGAKYGRDRIRVAYIGGEFREQATSYLIAELFELHDKNRFETFAVSTGANDHSAMRKRLEAAFDTFVDGSNRTDRDLAELLNRSEIDIAVNLNGYFGVERTGLFALRPCPIQVNYLGFPGTMGAEHMDYILADRHVIPEDQHGFYTEKVVYLPESYQVNDSKKRISERTPTRSEVGLPEQGFVFCCFNSSHKITPDMFDVWCRLLRQVDGSVLWLFERNDVAKRNLFLEAERRGIAPERIIFAARANLADHLARHRLADLFVDSLPHNAHTTASDALWAGLPVLTCLGTTFAGRVGASLLHAIGLPELVTRSIEDYEALALSLVRTPSLLATMKTKLALNRTTHPLFDTNRFRRHIEAAYTTMWARHQRGEPPTSFSVDPIELTGNP